MSEPINTLPPEWKDSAAETVRALAVARHLATRHATEEVPEAVLLPPLLVCVSMARCAAQLCNRIEGVYDAVDSIRDPMTVEHLAGIEREFCKIAETARDWQGKK
jgi:hypothetical protein